jgi:hypothetical protein
MPPERKGDILVFDYPRAGRTLVLDVTYVRWALRTPPVLHMRLEPHP